ncbi:MAG: DUF1640 domain-containing protein [Magnetococcales bacterium]|nr:DUF1640 domain-containing protein [Magnetococcales bacterium]
MALLAFDTLAISKELETAGFPPGQAAAQIRILTSLLEKIEAARLDEMATKADLAANTLKIQENIKELDARIKADFAANTLNIQENIKELDARIKELDARIKEMDVRIVSLESNLRRDMKEMDSNRQRDMKELELRMIIKLGTMSLAIVGLVFTLLRVFPPTVQFPPASPPISVTTADSQYPREPIPLRPPSPVPMVPTTPSAPINPSSGH